MEKSLTKPDANGGEVSPEIIKALVLEGDISKMNGNQRVEYYTKFCNKLGLNPLTQPFQIIKFQQKERLYATKDCTEQLRKIHGVSITEVTAQKIEGIYVVTAKAQDKNGKTDASTGAVAIEGIKGDNLANALMKAETKAKRRVTLSICGLGLLDESELDTMQGWQTQNINGDETGNGDATEEQYNTINELLERVNIPDNFRVKILGELFEGYTVERANKCIEWLKEQQSDPIAKGNNYNQGDITKKIQKEVMNDKIS